MRMTVHIFRQSLLEGFHWVAHGFTHERLEREKFTICLHSHLHKPELDRYVKWVWMSDRRFWKSYRKCSKNRKGVEEAGFRRCLKYPTRISDRAYWPLNLLGIKRHNPTWKKAHSCLDSSSSARLLAASCFSSSRQEETWLTRLQITCGSHGW